MGIPIEDCGTRLWNLRDRQPGESFAGLTEILHAGDDFLADEQEATIPVDDYGNDLPPEQAEDADEHRSPTVAEMLQRTGSQVEIVMVDAAGV